MSRDYKDRGERKSKRRRPAGKNVEKPGRWLLIGCLVLGFVAFLVYLKSTATHGQAKVISRPVEQDPAKPVKITKAEDAGKVEKSSAPLAPEFTFYTILPKSEAEVPDHELKTRIREELVGKVKSTQYTLQAGAFQEFKDADQLRAELALMGLSSKIEKAIVNGNVTWHRVKLGPYAKLDSVEKVRSRLKKSGIDVMITEVSR